MASKTYTIESIGDVTVYKRRGTKKLNLRVANNKIRVTLPTWLPYSSGVIFAKKNRDWIIKQINLTPIFFINDGDKIGKNHTFVIEPGKSLRTKLTDYESIIFLPPHLSINSPKSIIVVKKLIKKTLKQEAEHFLPQRTRTFAGDYGYKVANIRCKSMRSRWGSCNSQKNISLNVYLMTLNWDLIDYVIIHELVHTKHLNHSKKFWQELAVILPDFKQRQKDLKSVQNKTLTMH